LLIGRALFQGVVPRSLKAQWLSLRLGWQVCGWRGSQSVFLGPIFTCWWLEGNFDPYHIDELMNLTK